MMKFAMCGLVAIAMAASAGVAAADTCRDVTIKVRNEFTQDTAPVQIKVIDFDYWDDTEGKWREESFVSNLIVNPGALATLATRNLSFVGGENDVQIRVQFKYLTATNGWSETLDAISDPFTCISNRTVTVEVF